MRRYIFVSFTVCLCLDASARETPLKLHHQLINAYYWEMKFKEEGQI